MKRQLKLHPAQFILAWICLLAFFHEALPVVRLVTHHEPKSTGVWGALLTVLAFFGGLVMCIVVLSGFVSTGLFGAPDPEYSKEGDDES